MLKAVQQFAKIIMLHGNNLCGVKSHSSYIFFDDEHWPNLDHNFGDSDLAKQMFWTALGTTYSVRTFGHNSQLDIYAYPY